LFFLEVAEVCQISLKVWVITHTRQLLLAELEQWHPVVELDVGIPQLAAAASNMSGEP